MPISSDTQLNPDLPRYTLPTDSCVGENGPTPAGVMGPATIPYAGAGSAPVGFDPDYATDNNYVR